jgi:presenilin-like A22 family membrane protease
LSLQPCILLQHHCKIPKQKDKTNKKIKMAFPRKTLLLLFVLASTSAFSIDMSRRQAIQAAIGGVATVALPSILPANAVVSEETPRVVTRMGGLLVRLIVGAA